MSKDIFPRCRFFFYVYQHWPYCAKPVPSPPEICIFSQKRSKLPFLLFLGHSSPSLFYLVCSSPSHFFSLCSSPSHFILLWQNVAFFFGFQQIAGECNIGLLKFKYLLKWNFSRALLSFVLTHRPLFLLANFYSIT